MDLRWLVLMTAGWTTLALAQDNDLATRQQEAGERWQRALMLKQGEEAAIYLQMREELRRDPALIAGPDSSASQMYATAATFAGDYASARAHYPPRQPQPDPASRGYRRPSPALPAVLAVAKDRNVLVINESHADVRTRAMILSLLPGLRKAGFDILAMEAVTMSPTTGTCANAETFDAKLETRGHAVTGSGFYLREPVFGRIVREAHALGFRLEGYEHSDPASRSMQDRELGQARNLHCLLQANPGKRIVVIAGFGHASQAVPKDDGRLPLGMMAGLLKQKAGVRIATIDTTKLLDARLPPPTRVLRGEAGFVLRNARGEPFTEPGYDLLLATANTYSPTERPAWLASTPWQASRVEATGCERDAECVIEAREAGDEARATATDACLLTAPRTQRECIMYLRKDRAYHYRYVQLPASRD